MRWIASLIFVSCSLFSQNDCLRGIPSHFGFGYRGPSGIGYEDGYTSAFALLTPNWQRSFQPLLDVRGHLLTNGELASNLGLGARFDVASEVVAGLNAFYDFRSAKNLRAHQLGGGIELLHSIFNGWINGYLPVGHNAYTGPVKIDGFIGNTVFAKRKIVLDIPHIESQFGVWLPKAWPVDLFVSLGPYYLFSGSSSGFKCGDAWGIKTALEVMFFDGFKAGFSYSYDREFGSKPQGYVSLSLPLGPANITRGGDRWKKWYSKSHCQKLASKQRLMTSPIRRDEIIPICRTLQQGTLASFLGITTIPNCFFVNNSSSASGDGSFDNPFNNLIAAQSASSPGDCIYVFFGDGTSTNQNMGITLQTNQVLHGSSKDFVFEGVTILPAQSALPPVISNSAGDGITLADGTQVIALNIDGASGSGIATPAGSASNVTIQCNTIQNSGSFSINAGSASADIEGAWFITDNNIFGNSDEVFLRAAPGSTLTFASNTINEVLPAGNIVNIEPDSANIIVRNNTFSGSTVGGSSLLNLFIINTSNPSMIDIDSNSFDSTAFPIFLLQLFGDGSTATITNNTKLSPGGPEFILVNSFASLLLADITNNSGPGSIIANTIFGGTSAICANIVDNTAITGISLSNSGGGSFEASPGSAAAMSSANSGAAVAASASVVFNTTLPQPACTP